MKIKNIRIFIIFICLIGVLMSLYSDYNGYKKYKQFILYKTKDFKLLSDKEKTLIHYEKIIESFSHGVAIHSIDSNWIMSIMGNLHISFSRMFLYKNFFKRKELICSQSSYLLLKLLQEDKIKTRHVSILGHVIVEVWLNNKWNMFDPDLRVIVKENNDILSVNELVNRPSILKNYYNDDTVKMFLSEVNNSYVAYPEGSYFEWKTEVLKHYEYLMEILKYLLFVIVIYFIGKDNV